MIISSDSWIPVAQRPRDQDPGRAVVLAVFGLNMRSVRR
jgi:hypothetical protein